VLSGRNLTDTPLQERRELLQTRVMRRLREPIRFSETLNAPLDRVLEAVRSLGLEGVIAKHRRSSYEPGRRPGTWVKFRINPGQELVIGGYTVGGRTFDAILVGYYEGDRLMYAAKVRAGFVPALREALFKLFAALQVDTCPFANLPESYKGRWGEGLTAAEMAECRWLRPELGRCLAGIGRVSSLTRISADEDNHRYRRAGPS